jgi:hypothetical protein
VTYGKSVWQVGDSPEQSGTFKIESKKEKADTVRRKIRAGLPATLERSDIVRIVNIAWDKSFSRVDTNLKAIAERGWGALNYVLMDHPELQETNDRVESINDIYKKQNCAEITDLTSLNTDKGSMGLTMDMFLDNALQDKAIGKLTAAEKKEKRRQAGMLRKDGGARLSAFLMVITYGYAIGPDLLAWARRTRLDKEQKARDKQVAGQLERLKLKAKVDAVLAEGATPETGKWNNHDLKVMIQWFKRYGDKAMPKNKEGLLLRYRETHTRVVHGDRGVYLHEDSTKAFSEASAGCQAAAHVPPPTHVSPSVAATNTSIVAAFGAIAVDSATTTAVGAIVVDSAPTVPTSDCQQNDAPSNAPPLDWGELNPFDVGAHFNMEVPALPLCFASEDESCSDDDSVFLNLSRD